MKYIWLLCLIAVLIATFLLTKENITHITSFLTPYILFVIPIVTATYGVYAISKQEIIISTRRLRNPARLKGRVAAWLGWLLVIFGLSLALSFYPTLIIEVSM